MNLSEGQPVLQVVSQESYSFTVPIGATVGNTDLRIDFDNSGTHTTGFTTDV